MMTSHHLATGQWRNTKLPLAVHVQCMFKFLRSYDLRYKYQTKNMLFLHALMIFWLLNLFFW